jgi:hypothetical protein
MDRTGWSDVSSFAARGLLEALKRAADISVVSEPTIVGASEFCMNNPEIMTYRRIPDN